MPGLCGNLSQKIKKRKIINDDDDDDDSDGSTFL